jgi:Thiol-disulfide isomerase and thioredoxins
MKEFEDYGTKDWHEVTKEGKYILFFHADWCPDCKFIEPKLPELETEYSDFDGSVLTVIIIWILLEN